MIWPRISSKANSRHGADVEGHRIVETEVAAAIGVVEDRGVPEVVGEAEEGRDGCVFNACACIRNPEMPQGSRR